MTRHLRPIEMIERPLTQYEIAKSQRWSLWQIIFAAVGLTVVLVKLIWFAPLIFEALR